MSKQRKLRSKVSFDADEGDAADAPPPPPPASTAKKDGSSKPKKSALLSFGDDDEPISTSSKPKKKDKSAANVSKFHRGAAVAPAQPAPNAATTHRPPSGACYTGTACTQELKWAQCLTACTQALSPVQTAQDVHCRHAVSAHHIMPLPQAVGVMKRVASVLPH